MKSLLHRWPGLLLTMVVLACASNDQSGADTAREPDVAVVPAGQAAASCDTPAGGVRVTGAAVGGLPLTTGLRRLRELCPNARRDDPEDAPEESLGMAVDFPGVHVRVTFAASPSDDVDDAEPVNWAVSGDSVRFPDGELIPRTLGALRQRDSVGVVEPNDSDFRPDDLLVHLCRHPDLILVVAPASVRPAGEAPWPLASMSPHDTARIREVLVVPGPLDGVYTEWRSQCPASATRDRL